ncbi:MAG: metallophosphoesterase [Clostridia bacterium]|nr:metallophosphoesterase [Clostridia bacterium]
MKSVILRVTAALLTMLMLLFAGKGPGKEYDVDDPENCALNFSVLSDSHIEGNNFNRYKVFVGSLRDLENKKTPNDAVVFLGDNTMNCQNIENMLFHGAASAILGDEAVFSVVGNHDIGNADGDGNHEKLQNRWYDYTESFFGRDLDKPYYYDVVNGFYFIVLGMEKQFVHEMYMSDEQYSWLEGVLAEAAESGKPAFVFSHYPADYMIDEDGEETDRLINILAAYNEEHDVFYFCGHTHMPLFLFWSFHDDEGFPEIYLPRLTDLSGENDNEIFSRSGIGVEVEVYDGSVYVRGRNFYAGEWLVDDEDTGEMCEMTYALKNPIG